MNRPALLSTKLFAPPARKNAVPRPRVYERLDDALGVPLTVISAGAGYGKSTALAQWIGSRDRLVGWLSLDERDDSPRRVLRYLLAALTNAGFEPSESLLRDAWDGEVEWTAVMAAFVNEVVEHDGELVVVLDDYHVIDQETGGAVVGELLKAPPPNLHLVLSTRIQPPLDLARMRANARIVEIGERDLRFRGEEAAEFLRSTMQIDVSDADLAALEQRTEGWVAGLQMAALALRSDPATQDAMDIRGHHHPVAEYLVQEVLATLDDSARSDLLCCAVLDELRADIIEAVLDIDDATSFLREIEQNNLFVIPLDAARRTFRFHHLFRQLLRARLADEADESDVRALHRRAAVFLQDRGLLEQALAHAHSSGDVAFAAGIFFELLRRQGFETDSTVLKRWLREFGSRSFQEHTVLVVCRLFVTIVTMDAESLVEDFETARRLLEAQPDPLLEGWVDAMQGLVMLHANEREVARQLLERACESKLEGAVEMMARYYLAEVRLVDGALADALELLDHLVVEHGHSETAVLGHCLRQAVLFEMGEAQRACGGLEYHVEEALQRWGGGIPRNYAIAMCWIGQFACMRGEVALGRSWFDKAEELASDLIGLGATVPLRMGMVRVQIGEPAPGWWEHWGEVADDLQRRDLRPHALHMRTQRAVTGMDARTNVSEVQAAREWLALPESRDFSSMLYGSRPNLASRHWEPWLCYCRASIAVGELDEAQAFAEVQLAQSEAEGRVLCAVEWKLLLAEIASRRGRPDEMSARVAEAIPRVATSHFLWPFLWLGGEVQAEGHRQLEAAGHLRLAERLAPADPAEELPDGVEPLSSREIEVLELIAAGCSNKEASKRLFVAPSTVKKHLEHIYDKLGVRSRTKAVALARDLGYVE